MNSVLLLFRVLFMVSILVICVQQETDNELLSSYTLHRNDVEPTYVIVASKVIHPATLYGVTITLLDNSRIDYAFISIRIVISKNDLEVISVTENVPVSSTQTFFLKVPSSCTAGQYMLKVEGNYPHTSRGSVFSNKTEIVFSPQFLSIIIQTSRPIYKSGQTVRFRVVLLNTELKPYEDAVTVYVLNSDGVVVRRWVSTQINNGVISEKFALPQLVDNGFWKIRVQALDQIQDQRIRVEKYFSPLFEVHVSLPAYILDTEKYVAANISARSDLERIARGNATIRLYGKYLNRTDSMKLIWEDKVSMKNGKHYLLIPMETVNSIMGSVTNIELRVETALTEYLYGETVTGFSYTRIISGSVNLYFLGSPPMVFMPGMLFEGYAVVTYQDKERLSEEKLEYSTLRIEISAQYESGSSTNLPDIVALPKDEQMMPNEIEDPEWNGNGFTTEYADIISVNRYREEGILYFKFEVPPKVSKITLKGFYQDADGDSAQAETKVVQFFSPHEKYMRVWTSTHDAEAGEFAIFHVKTNFKLESFQYMVLSKGFLLHADRQIVESNSQTITTFAVAVDPSMAPGFRLLVYHVTLQGELIADSVFVPVNGFNGYEIYLFVNQGKDHTKKTAQAVMPAKAGAFMAVNSVRSLSYFMQAGNEMSKSRVIESLFAFENHTRSQPKVKWISREGLVPDEVMYVPSIAGGKDSNETFKSNGVIVFTDAYIAVKKEYDPCNEKSGYAPCFSEGCFLEAKKCDGYNDCDDGSDETDCTDEDEDQYEYRIMRISRSDELYDTAGEDWGWQEMNGEYGGEEYFTMKMPDVSDDWYFMGFCFSRSRGFTIIDTPIAFSSTRPFMMHVEGPSACRRGEQLGLRLLLVNNEPYEILAVVTLHDSPDYKFVHVEENGIVSSYGARLTSGSHQHLVYLPPFAQQHVDLPVAPAVEQGDIDIVISAMTQVGKYERIHKITVLGEGAMLNKHTAAYLDLKNRALVLQYFDMYVEESPIVPYQNWRRYVFGSTSGEITLTGDIIGPAFPSVPLTAGALLGREVKGTDGRVFELAINIWTLHYLRLTNQLQWNVGKQILEDANVIFAQIMKRFDKSGWFKNWDTSRPSVWLTAWAIRIFKHASFQDWENIFYVEPDIFSNCLEWILGYQTNLGSFEETPWYDNPLDWKMRGKKVNGVDSIRYQNVSLTAHVLITIQEVMQIVQGSIRTEAAKASVKAIRHLERQLPSLKDPFDIAIATYALTLCDSIDKEYAFKLLQKNSREVGDGLIYWSRVPVPQNLIKIENHRPFIWPREYQTDDTLAVEATSYALMVYLMREGVTYVPEKIVQWLTTMRMSSSAFISTTDSALALQALTEYAFRARLKDITDMTVTMELPSTPRFRHTLHVDNRTFSEIQKLPIPNVWGHLNIIAKGSGQAIVQMDVKFGVDYDLFKQQAIIETFELDVTEYYSSFRNKTFITIQSCFRWILQDPPVSGSSVLEVDLPTGYNLLESEAEDLVMAGVHPTLRDAKTIEGKTYWYFEYITQKRTCFNHTVKRWYPVANISLVRQVLLYETYARENFIMMLVNSTPLYVLNICEVCGSYQCPYCPYYSKTAAIIPNKFLVIIFTLISIVHLTSRMLHIT